MSMQQQFLVDVKLETGLKNFVAADGSQQPSKHTYIPSRVTLLRCIPSANKIVCCPQTTALTYHKAPSTRQAM